MGLRPGVLTFRPSARAASRRPPSGIRTRSLLGGNDNLTRPAHGRCVFCCDQSCDACGRGGEAGPTAPSGPAGLVSKQLFPITRIVRPARFACVRRGQSVSREGSIAWRWAELRFSPPASPVRRYGRRCGLPGLPDISNSWVDNPERPAHGRFISYEGSIVSTFLADPQPRRRQRRMLMLRTVRPSSVAIDSCGNGSSTRRSSSGVHLRRSKLTRFRLFGRCHDRTSLAAPTLRGIASTSSLYSTPASSRAGSSNTMMLKTRSRAFRFGFGRVPATRATKSMYASRSCWLAVTREINGRLRPVIPTDPSPSTTPRQKPTSSYSHRGGLVV